MMRRRGAIGVALAVAIIALATLRAAPTQADRVAETAWHCLACGEAGATDVLLNLLLFLPLGLALRVRGIRWPAAGALILGLTLAVEAAQATLLPGRDASLGDVIANTLGGLGGWFAGPLLGALVRPSHGHARAAAAALLIGATASWLFTGWGLHPEGSTSGPWVGQHTRLWAGHDPFPGSLGLAVLNDLEVPNDPLAAVPVLDAKLTLSLLLMRRDATTPQRPVSILRIVDGAGALQMGAAQHREALLLTTRLRASRLRVRTPAWRYDEAMRMPTDVPWSITWRWSDEGPRLARGVARGPAPSEEVVLPRSVGLGWAFVHPIGAAIGADALGWTAAWFACWFLPFGWCLARLRRIEAALWAVLPVAGYTFASRMTGTPVREAEVLLLLGVLLLGALAAATFERLRPAPTSLPH